MIETWNIVNVASNRRPAVQCERGDLHHLWGKCEMPMVKSIFALMAVLFLVTGSVAQDTAALGARVVVAARQQIGVTKEYDPAYTAIKYPGGDVPLQTGVCSDVVVRALRQVGIDLQKEIHEDMRKDFSAYPQMGT